MSKIVIYFMQFSKIIKKLSCIYLQFWLHVSIVFSATSPEPYMYLCMFAGCKTYLSIYSQNYKNTLCDLTLANLLLYTGVIKEKCTPPLYCIPQTTPLITFTHVIIVYMVRTTLRIIILYYARGHRLSFKKGLHDFYLVQTFPLSGHGILTAVKRRGIIPIFKHRLQNKIYSNPIPP